MGYENTRRDSNQPVSNSNKDQGTHHENEGIKKLVNMVPFAVGGVLVIFLVQLGLLGPSREDGIVAQERRWAQMEVKLASIQTGLDILRAEIEKGNREKMSTVDFDRWLVELSRANPDLNLPPAPRPNR